VASTKTTLRRKATFKLNFVKSETTTPQGGQTRPAQNARRPM
jgi:hypothetical protein